MNSRNVNLLSCLFKSWTTQTYTFMRLLIELTRILFLYQYFQAKVIIVIPHMFLECNYKANQNRDIFII